VQSKLKEGTGDKSNECRYCVYGIQKKTRYGCAPSQDAGFFRCPNCGYCNSFKPITDDYAETEFDLMEPDDPEYPLVKTTFNRWKWRKNVE